MLIQNFPFKPGKQDACNYFEKTGPPELDFARKLPDELERKQLIKSKQMHKDMMRRLRFTEQDPRDARMSDKVDQIIKNSELVKQTIAQGK